MSRASVLDPARADVSVEKRHALAHRVAAKAAAHARPLRHVLDEALRASPARCLDNDADREAVLEELLRAIRASADATFLRDLLGHDPLERLSRLNAHGALSGHACEAAWRLAGGRPA